MNTPSLPILMCEANQSPYEIPPEDITLIRAFITREAYDYASHRNDDKWIDATLEQVKNYIICNGKTVDKINIISLSNLGRVMRTLSIETNIKADTCEKARLPSQDFYITLCPCGRPEHIKTEITRKETSKTR